MIANARADLLAQADPDADSTGLLRRYPKAVVAKFNAEAPGLTEMDALVAYLQMLGTLVRFTDITPAQLRQ
jgi:cytochrome c oxidase cbb3-type subunit 2